MSVKQFDRIPRRQEIQHALEAVKEAGTLEPMTQADIDHLALMKTQTVWQWMKTPLPISLSLEFCVGLMSYMRLVRTGRVQPWLNAK